MNPKLQEIAGRLEREHYEASGNIYHPLPFPEFENLKVSSSAKSAYDKWNLIFYSLPSSLPKSKLKILDVGANAGFYSFNFAKLGAQVDAYEPHSHYVQIGEQITDAVDLRIQWYNKPLDVNDLAGSTYDVALMLSVFQWISEGDAQLEKAKAILRTVASSAQVLYFELGCNSGKSAIHTTERPIGWVWRILCETVAPKDVVYLGTTTAWGKAHRYFFACTNIPLQLTAWQRFVTYLLRKRWLA